MSGRFVADVGGTNIRLAREVHGELIDIKKYLCNDYDSIAQVIQLYFDEFPDIRFRAGCIGIACPVIGDHIKMTNHHWQFSIKELKSLLRLDWLDVINDYDAVAMSLPVLSDAQKHQIGGGSIHENAPIAVFGPGTGLGVGHLINTGVKWQPLDGEGGHINFAPVDETDLIIWRYLTQKYGYASAEEVMSGRGLVQIYEALAEYQGKPIAYNDPADVSKNAIAGSCTICEAALTQFCASMGTFAGNLALSLGTLGGVYIAGGITQRFVDFLEASPFRERFEAKGRFKGYVSAIPTFVITEPDHGLLGTAAYLEQYYKG